jgi:hypothetical protein
MGKEQQGIPDWARRERLRDMDWIAENFHVFSPAATASFQEQGRGALVVDTTQRPTGVGHPFGYFSESFFEERDDPDVKRMIKQYDPEKEFVVLMLKQQDRMSTYRVQTAPRTS